MIRSEEIIFSLEYLYEKYRRCITRMLDVSFDDECEHLTQHNTIYIKKSLLKWFVHYNKTDFSSKI